MRHVSESGAAYGIDAQLAECGSLITCLFLAFCRKLGVFLLAPVSGQSPAHLDCVYERVLVKLVQNADSFC